MIIDKQRPREVHKGSLPYVYNKHKKIDTAIFESQNRRIRNITASENEFNDVKTLLLDGVIYIYALQQYPKLKVFYQNGTDLNIEISPFYYRRFFISDNNFIYAVSFSQNTIDVYNSSLFKLNSTVIHHQFPTCIKHNRFNDYIYVCDSLKLLVSVFDMKINHIRSFKTENLIPATIGFYENCMIIGTYNGTLLVYNATNNVFLHAFYEICDNKIINEILIDGSSSNAIIGCFGISKLKLCKLNGCNITCTNKYINVSEPNSIDIDHRGRLYVASNGLYIIETK